MRTLAIAYAVLVAVVAAWAFYVDISMLHSQREHLLPDMVLAFLTLPSSLSVGPLYDMWPAIFSRPLTQVTTSVAHLKTVWPGGTWPEGLTFEQDLIDLGWHQKEFQIRRSFAYTVVTPSESQVIGCVYINPTPKRGYDAVVYLWARQSELAGGLESRLYTAVQEWIAKEWPFKKVAFPGRSIDWDTWRSIPDEKR